jgi:hypothetical protein
VGREKWVEDDRHSKHITTIHNTTRTSHISLLIFYSQLRYSFLRVTAHKTHTFFGRQVCHIVCSAVASSLTTQLTPISLFPIRFHSISFSKHFIMAKYTNSAMANFTLSPSIPALPHVILLY